MEILILIIGILVGFFLGGLFFTVCIYNLLKKIKEVIDEISAETDEVDKVKLYKDFYNESMKRL